MNSIYHYIKSLFLVLLVGAFTVPFSYAQDRIVTAGGSITEIIYQLGKQNELVGVDMTSTYPDDVKSLPQIGYWKQLSIEGLLSLKPTLFIAWADSEPVQIFEQLNAANINVLKLQRVPNNLSLLLDNIDKIAQAVNRQEQGNALIEHIRSQVETVNSKIDTKQKPNVMFLFSISGVTQVSGKNTVADSVIELAGGNNIATHNGYKNFSAEAMITANPDIILLTSQSADALGGIENLSKFPGIIHTKAWKENRIVTIDQTLILGMGPRVGDAVNILYNAFYPQ